MFGQSSTRQIHNMCINLVWKMTYHGTDSHYPCTHPTALNANERRKYIIIDVSTNVERLWFVQAKATNNFRAQILISSSFQKIDLGPRPINCNAKRLTLPKPLLNGFFEELAGGGVVMVVKLLIMPPAALLHAVLLILAFCFAYCNYQSSVVDVKIFLLRANKSNNLTAADNGIVAAVYIS